LSFSHVPLLSRFCAAHLKQLTMSDHGDGGDALRTFSTFTNPAETKSTVIIGAGIIGCATAYYLSRSGNTKPDTIHLIEASPELFASASGKGAGFLASDCTVCTDTK